MLTKINNTQTIRTVYLPKVMD